jgi:hypothetical protein
VTRPYASASSLSKPFKPPTSNRNVGSSTPRRAPPASRSSFRATSEANVEHKTEPDAYSPQRTFPGNEEVEPQEDSSPSHRTSIYPCKVFRRHVIIRDQLDSSDDDIEEQRAVLSNRYRVTSPEPSPPRDGEELISPSQEEAKKDSSLLVNPYTNKVNVSAFCVVCSAQHIYTMLSSIRETETWLRLPTHCAVCFCFTPSVIASG